MTECIREDAGSFLKSVGRNGRYKGYPVPIAGFVEAAHCLGGHLVVSLELK